MIIRLFVFFLVCNSLHAGVGLALRSPALVARATPATSSSITFIAATSATNSSIAVPSGTSSGDLMLAFVGAFNASTVTVPSGWTQVGSTFLWQSSQYSSALLYRVAGSSEPSTYTFSTGTYNYGWIATYRGPSQIDVAGSFEEKSGTSMSFAGIASASGSTLLACIHDRDDVSFTVPSGMTSRVNATSGFLWRVGLAELNNASNSARVWSVASSSFNAAGILVSIK